jgi:hypothetical protein
MHSYLVIIDHDIQSHRILKNPTSTNFLELIWDFSKNTLHDNVFFTAVHDSCLDITRTQSFNENDKSSEEWISYLNLGTNCGPSVLSKEDFVNYWKLWQPSIDQNILGYKPFDIKKTCELVLSLIPDIVVEFLE